MSLRLCVWAVHVQVTAYCLQDGEPILSQHKKEEAEKKKKKKQEKQDKKDKKKNAELAKLK